MTGPLIGLGSAALAYGGFVQWMRAQARQALYHPVWSPVFRALTGGTMQATTLWNITLLLLSPADRLSLAGWRHEDVHVAQFNAHPFLFPVLYGLESARHGYQNNKYEIAARAAEGQA